MPLNDGWKRVMASIVDCNERELETHWRSFAVPSTLSPSKQLGRAAPESRSNTSLEESRRTTPWAPLKKARVRRSVPARLQNRRSHHSFRPGNSTATEQWAVRWSTRCCSNCRERSDTRFAGPDSSVRKTPAGGHTEPPAVCTSRAPVWVRSGRSCAMLCTVCGVSHSMAPGMSAFP